MGSSNVLSLATNWGFGEEGSLALVDDGVVALAQEEKGTPAFSL